MLSKFVVGLDWKTFPTRHTSPVHREEGMMNRKIDREITPALLNMAEFCDYLGIGETKARELLHDPKNGFTVRIGNRLYAHKGKVDHWLLKQLIE